MKGGFSKFIISSKMKIFYTEILCSYLILFYRIVDWLNKCVYILLIKDR